MTQGHAKVVSRCQVCDSQELQPVCFVGYLPPVNTMLPNTDSFFTTGHNYFLYLNPRTNKIRAITVGRGPRSLATSRTAIWISNRLSNTVSRLNPKTLKVVATIRVGKGPENPAVADDGTVYVPNTGANTLSRIDPATNRVIDVIDVGPGPFPAASAFGDIWVPSSGGTEVYRVHAG